MLTTKTLAKLNIKKAGAACSIQDLGRKGFQYLGLSQGGAADLHAYLWANYLIENNAGAAAFEITLGQFAIEFEADTEIAITGAEANATINGESVALWCGLKIKAGDLLEIKLPRTGLLNYLSISGGIQCEQHFGSRTIVAREKTGPNGGCTLKLGDNIHYLARTSKRKSTRSTPSHYIPDYGQSINLKAIPTPASDYFSASEVERFLASSYLISPQSNRMGYRLKGASLKSMSSGLPSEGINFGAVQVPADGNPIILLSDRQTLGGYPKIASISKLDCYQLAQRRPGQEIRFEEASIPQCQNGLREFLNFFGL